MSLHVPRILPADVGGLKRCETKFRDVACTRLCVCFVCSFVGVCIEFVSLNDL